MSSPYIKPTTSFWIVAVLSLLWNLGGVSAFIMQVTMSPETLHAMTEPERALYTDLPSWLLLTYAVAVFGSTLGSILLLLRQKLAMQVFVVSFVAILVQMIYSLFFSKAIEVHGPSAVGLPISVIVIGAFLVWYSLLVNAKGWYK